MQTLAIYIIICYGRTVLSKFGLFATFSLLIIVVISSFRHVRFFFFWFDVFAIDIIIYSLSVSLSLSLFHNLQVKFEYIHYYLNEF